MFDARKLLDVLIGAAARIGHPPGQSQQSGGAAQQVTGQTPEQLVQAARRIMEQHPGLAQAAAIGLAGILLGKPKPGRGLSANLAKLGGLAVIGGLAYRAWQNSRAGRPLLDMGGGAATEGAAPPAGQESEPAQPASAPAAAASSPAGQGEAGAAYTFHALDVPEGSRFHPVSHAEDDVLLFLRTMVAAATADGRIDKAERDRIVKGLTEAGIDPAATGWLDREMASPADVEELAAGVSTPEKAAQVYAAARIAIDPDTLQEREFLRELAETLDLDHALQAQIDDMATKIKAG